MIRLADGRSAYGYWREPVTNQEIINRFHFRLFIDHPLRIGTILIIDPYTPGTLRGKHPSERFHSGQTAMNTKD